MPTPNQDRVTYLARVDFRNDRRVFGIRRRDRRSHLYMLGKTGTGKSTLLANMIRQDINAGEGLAVLDPHGELVAQALESVPEWRKPDLIHFNVPDSNLGSSGKCVLFIGRPYMLVINGSGIVARDIWCF
jgi:DNA helicase HerA-like ATPase